MFAACLCLKCNKLAYIPIFPNIQIYQNGPTPTSAESYYPNYPSQNGLALQSPAKYQGQAFANLELDEPEEPLPIFINHPEPAQATYSLQETPIAPRSFMSTTPAADPRVHLRKVNNKNRHVPYNISTKIAHNRNKGPIIFDLIFTEDIEDRRPIPKKSKRVIKHSFITDSKEEIKKSVEKIFPKLRNRAWEFLKVESFKLVPANVPWTISELKG
ncbi:hypothetical protein RclHR1_00750004 [Rhizophagus clarus]|nr:hypothetical protein RclHR1_00750004 [Rhizophagus clarus]